MKRSKPKHKSAKSLQNKAMELAKEYVFLRDGKVCQVKKHSPNISIRHSPVIQVDHCFSRSIKELFLDVANLTPICSTCNAIKGSGRIGASKRDAITVAVHEIVKKREGTDTYNRLLEIASSMCAFINWSKRWWLEGQIAILEAMVEEKILEKKLDKQCENVKM